MKAIVIARAYLKDDNMDLTIVPSFTDVLIDGNERTAVRFSVLQGPSSLEPALVTHVNSLNSLMEPVVA